MNKQQFNQWVAEGTITQDQADKMLADLSKQSSDDKSKKFVGIVAAIGAVLIFLGLAWIVAINWNDIPNFLRVVIMFGATAAAFIAGVHIREKYLGISSALLGLGAMLFFLSLILISQTYNMSTELQHYAWIFLVTWMVIIGTAYFFKARANVIIGMVFFFIWLFTQYASQDSYSASAILGYIILLASAGLLLYGVTALHRKHQFFAVYRFWTIFYLLAVMYLFSFQAIIILTSQYAFDLNLSSFIFIILVMSLAVFFLGTFKTPEYKEVSFSYLGIFLVLIILSLVSGFYASDNGYCRPDYSLDSPPDYYTCSVYNDQKQSCTDAVDCQWRPSVNPWNDDISTTLWILWAVINVLFVGLILIVMWYAQKINSPSLINLALGVFVLDVITRYIGFWMDLSGFFGFSFLAIIGGLLLIVGAWLVPKWRKKLIEGAR